VHSEEGRILAPGEILFFPTHKSGQKGIYSSARQIFFDNLGSNREFIDERGQYSDWALVRLNAPLGDEFGWMSIADTQVTRGGVTLAGFSGDYNEGQTAGIHAGCSINEVRERGVVVHDCDTTAGSSGSALFRVRGSDYQIIALNSAESADPTTGMRYSGPVDYSPEVAFNMAVKTDGFSDLVRELRAVDTGKDDAFVTICNYNPTSARFALAFPSRNDWRTGQASLDPHECIEAIVSDSGDLDVYLRDFNASNSAQNDRTFCVSGDGGPVDGAGGPCANRARFVPFRKITAHAGQLNVHFLEAGKVGREEGAAAAGHAGAATETNICNRSVNNVSAAYAWVEHDGIVSRGWLKLEPGSCSTARLPNGYSGDLAVHGQAPYGYYGRDVPICVDGVSKFEIRDAGRTCSGKNLGAVPFSIMRVFPGQQNVWTFR
jgi:uncharacterized membrane protein